MVNQFGAPGLGSIAGGRRVIGTLQLFLALAGVGLLAVWIFQFSRNLALKLIEDAPPPPLADADAATTEPPSPSLPTPEAAVPPHSASWTILTALKWKNGHPVAPHGIIKAHNGDGKIHQLTPWADGLWCMTCSSESCPAVEVVLATRPAPKDKAAQAA